MNISDHNREHSRDGVVQMWLDSYDDMFSDFDPRPFPTRMWSDDFIFQIRKVIKEHPKKVTVLRILLPEKVRKESVDEMLAERLSNYFISGRSEVVLSKKKAIYKGILYILIGTSIMLVIEYIKFINKKNFSWHLLLQVLEPLSWFLIWMGLDTIVDSRKTMQDLRFFSKLANVHIEFSIY